jgi:hypothetical protein
MSVNSKVVLGLVAFLVIGSAVAMAQSTTYEIRQGEVLNVYGNHLVVRMADGTVRDVEVPSDFMFDVDGKKVPVTGLKPGTKLTQTIATTTTPVEVKTTEVREAVIVQRIGQTLIYRDERNRLHKITGIPEGFTVTRDGREVPITALAGGDRVTAHIVHTETTMVTEEEMGVAGAAPKPAPAAKPVAVPKPAPAPAPKPAPAPVLPKTGSALPLAWLVGLLALGLGLGLAAIRRS